MSLRPTAGRILVHPIQDEDLTASGIVIPDTAQHKPQQGEVVAVGPGQRTKRGKEIPPSVEAGDVIVFTRFGGSEITEDGDKLVMLLEQDIIGVVDEAA